MANIIVLGVKVPFTSGGQEILVRDLVRELKARGHNADFMELPFAAWPKENMLNQLAYWRSIDLSALVSEKVDLVIATKFPTYFVKHHTKSVWLVHQHRAIYDLYGGRYSDFGDDLRDEQLRQLIYDGDQQTLGEADFLSGISNNVCKRLKQFNQLDAETLYPPLPLGGQYYSADAENYILSVGRLCSIKRVDLMIKAMPLIPDHIKLKIVGLADEQGIMDYYKNEIAKHHLEQRVEFLGRVSIEDLLSLFAKSLAVYYAPFNEDYGYVTLESFASGKPVITAKDSGGILEFVEHEKNALIAEPSSESIAEQANRFVNDFDFAAKLGQAGREWIEQSGLDQDGWDQVISGLLSPLAAKQSADTTFQSKLG